MRIKRLKSKKVLLLILVIVSICIITILLSNSSEKEITFPYEDDGLKIESIFEYTGINVDNKDEEGEEIASIQIKNTSEDYLKEAKIKITSNDDQVFEFIVKDVPSKKSTLVFDKKNKSSLNISKYKDIDIETKYVESQDYQEKLEIDIDDNSKMKMTNKTDSPLNDIVIVYKCKMDDSYFGGISYTYKIKRLKSKQTVEYIDNDCLMGKAEITSVTIGK